VDLAYDGTVALVTGGTRGIGRAIAASLQAEGCTVVVTGRTQESVDAALSGAEPTVPGVPVLSGLAADLNDSDIALDLVTATVERHGRLDVLVNNAAGFSEGHFLESPLEDWTSVYQLKLIGYLAMARAAAPHLRERGGSIVNIAGIAGIHAMPGSGHAGAVNAAVLNLTTLMARELARDGIRVNAVSPGSVNTDRMETRIEATMQERGQTREEVEAYLDGRVPMGSRVDPHEVGLTVAMLCSPRLRSVVGNNLVVDGGFTL
jgi:meso-butanediol dehydrogenase/(S,S)-butanediol dehydrogenase/diacetyl reductase